MDSGTRVATETTPAWWERVADGLRVELTRQRRSQSDLAQVIGRSRIYVSRRVNGHLPFQLDEIEAAAEWLGVSIASLAAEERS